MSHKLITQKGAINENGNLSTLGRHLPEFQTHITLNGTTYPLTRLKNFNGFIIWFHTTSSSFPVLNDRINTLIYQLRTPNKNIPIYTQLKIIAEIHFLESQKCQYLRGSAAIAEILSGGLLYTLGLHFPESKALGVKPDALALSLDNISEFVDFYPACLSQEICDKIIKVTINLLARKVEDITINR